MMSQRLFVSSFVVIGAVHLGLLIATLYFGPNIEGGIGRGIEFAPARSYEYRDELAAAKILLEGSGIHIESLAFDRHGKLFASADESIIEINLEENTYKEVIHLGPRPGFITFDNNNMLLVGDFVKGLLEVNLITKEVKILATSAEGIPFRFTQTIAVSSDNETLYFTVASRQPLFFESASVVPDLFYSGALVSLRAKPDGRLISYNRKTKAIKTLAENFVFANGCAFDQNETSIFLVDTSLLRLWRYFIKGDKAGSLELVNEGLPCLPDNMSRGHKLGGLLVACPMSAPKASELFAPYTILRKIASLIPPKFFPFPPRFAGCMHFNEDGKLVHVYSDSRGLQVHHTTQCIERDGVIYTGGLELEGIAAVKVL